MTHHVHPASPVLGSIRADGDGTGTVRMESLYATDPDDLWSALTAPDRLARWIAQVDGDLRVGGAISTSFTSGWEGPGRIDVCEAPARLVVTLDPGTIDATTIEATLSPEGSETRSWSRNGASRSPRSALTARAGRPTWRTLARTCSAADRPTGAPDGAS